MQLEELEPQKVFYYFSQIAAIPHGSGNLDAIRQYLLDFAQEHTLEAYRDTYGNVTIFKPGTHGYEQSEPVILQGHMDMVCEKRPDCPKDMAHDPIELVVDGDYLRANGTTLGADDGIAVAYILALLDDRGIIEHPPLEAVFTADEEINLRGAHALDASRLIGRRLINLDSEEEGVLTVSCAGGAGMVAKIPIRYETPDETLCAMRVSVGGLLGGHSGMDIGKGRKSAVKILAFALDEMNSWLKLRPAALSAGGKLNVIPSTAEAVVCFDRNRKAAFETFLDTFRSQLDDICGRADPNAFLTACDVPMPERVLDPESSETVLAALLLAPHGVSEMSPDVAFLVQTSSNLGSVELEEDALRLGWMVRSNINSGIMHLVRQIRCLVERGGGVIVHADSYPAWEYRRDSRLRDELMRAHMQMYGRAPKIQSVHAGLECGILSKKLDDADIVSIGPNLLDVHTPNERLEIASARRTWEYLLHVLKCLK